MKRIPVHEDNGAYINLLKSAGPNRYKELRDADLKTAPPNACIVTGMKTKEFGGGKSPDGFLMNGTQMLGRLRIEGRVVGGAIMVP